MRTQRAWFPIVTALMALGTLACVCGSNPLERFQPTLDASTVDLTLREGMQIDTRPIESFEKQVSTERVDPGNADGGSRLTVMSYDGATLVLRLEQTLELTEEDAAMVIEMPAFDPANPDSIIIPTIEYPTHDPNAPPPETRLVAIDTTITATGMATSHGPMRSPYGNPEGEAISTDGSLIWLSTEAFAELSSSGSTAWGIDALTALSSMPQFGSEVITGADMVLTMTNSAATFDVRINGRKSQVAALVATDNYGNTYTILNDAANPLILQFYYSSEGTGLIGIDMPFWALVKSLAPGYGVVEIRTP